MRPFTRRCVMVLAAVTCGANLLAAQSLEIWQIQGPGMASPYAGQRVTTSDDVVTAVGPHGFFIQTPAGRSDGNSETSDGIYVYTNAVPAVDPGDRVDVTGTVTEYHGLTEIGSNPTVTITGTGAPLPSPVELDARNPTPNRPQPQNELERWEGMRVHIASGTVTGPTDRYGNFTVVSRNGRAFREPGIVFPGLPGLPVWDGNPEVLEVDPEALGLPPQEVAAGSPLHDMTGVLSYAFGSYQIWPTILGVETTSPLAPVRPRVRGEITVGTQNLERFYDDVDDPQTDDTVVSSDELDLRLKKASLWIRLVLSSPDILALEEVENLDVLNALAGRIEADDPSVHYTPYLIPGNDFSGMNVAVLVRSSVTVDSLEQLDADDTFNVDDTTYMTFDRPPLLLRCRVSTGGASVPLIVIAVHLRSLNGIDDPIKGDFVRQKRFREALDLSNDVERLQQDDPSIHLIVLGDFNAFPFSDGYVDVMGQITGRIDPLGALLPATRVVVPPLTDEVALLPSEERYTFVNQGSADDLDHILTSSALGPWIRGVGVGRGDADAPVAFADDPSTAERISDHDGLVLYLMTDADGDGVPDDLESAGGRTSRHVCGRLRNRHASLH